MSRPTLYYFHEATCGLKARLTLLEKRVDFEKRVIDRYELTSPEYLALNPLALVPTLVHGEHVITESSLIALYIDDVFSGPALMPSSAIGRHEARDWLHRIDEAYFPALSVATFALMVRHEVVDRFPSADDQSRYLDTIKHAGKRAQRAELLKLGHRCGLVDRALAELQNMVQRIEDRIATGEYLLGNDFSVADACLAPFAFRLEVLNLLPSSAGHPRFNRWWQSVRARPSFQQILAESFQPAYFTAAAALISRNQ